MLIYSECHYAVSSHRVMMSVLLYCHYDESCGIFGTLQYFVTRYRTIALVVMLRVIMRSVIMMNAIVLSVFMLSHYCEGC